MESVDLVNAALFSGIEPPAVNGVAGLIPWIELEWLKASRHKLEVCAYAPWIARMRRAVKTRRPHWSELDDGYRRGFVRTWRKWEDITESTWVQFLGDLARAAKHSGLHKSIAQQIVGAVCELEDNVHDHSGNARSGMIAFSAKPGCIELVIVDRGIGVLGSLQQEAEFSGLKSHAEALRAAVRSGASRYGLGSGHGQGFNRLFLGLADTAALLRFRSGDALLELDGRSQSAMACVISPAGHAQGFYTAIRIEP